MRRLSEGVTNPNELMKLVHGRIVNRHGAETILASLTGVVSQAEIDVLRPLHEEIDIVESHRNECYISKCKGDMRLYLRRKGKLPCFSYLVRGKSFSFYRGKMPLYKKISESSAAKTQSKTPLKIETIYRIERYVCNPIYSSISEVH